jgi:hypothetical protein
LVICTGIRAGTLLDARLFAAIVVLEQTRTDARPHTRPIDPGIELFKSPRTALIIVWTIVLSVGAAEWMQHEAPQVRCRHVTLFAWRYSALCMILPLRSRSYQLPCTTLSFSTVRSRAVQRRIGHARRRNPVRLPHASGAQPKQNCSNAICHPPGSDGRSLTAHQSYNLNQGAHHNREWRLCSVFYSGRRLPRPAPQLFFFASDSLAVDYFYRKVPNARQMNPLPRRSSLQIAGGFTYPFVSLRFFFGVGVATAMPTRTGRDTPTVIHQCMFCKREK